MKPNQNISMLAIIVLSVAWLTAAQSKQTVIHCQDKGETLAQRWVWAMSEANSRGISRPYWIGYSFNKLMDGNSFVGSFYSDERSNEPTLCELLELQPCIRENTHARLRHRETISGSVTFDDGTHGSNEKTVKPIGVLIEIGKSGDGSGAIDDIKTSNLSLYADLDNEPLIWLGEAGDTSSVGFLQSLYDQNQPEDVQKNIISAVGLHPASDIAESFLASVLREADRTDVRKDAAFWLGQSDGKRALGVLAGVARNDESEGVMESAVFAISQMESEQSTDTLIALARGGNGDEMRKQAMFWLGQKASRKATATLEAIANDNDDEEVQKNAVFALTQLDDDEGVEALIRIAKTHANPAVRKSAIFWLGQSEDKRALEALIDIVHN